MIASALARLRESLGEDAVLTADSALERYLIDERRLYHGRAAAVLRPRTTEEVALAVRVCAEARIAMVPQGGNTGYCGGATPDESGREVVISLERLRQIRALDAQGFTLTAEAGVTLAELQQAAAAGRRLFPLSMGSEGACQLGGVLSTNAGGLAVLRYGTARELVLGLEVVLPDGQIWHGLSALRKDNTGYDLKQCFLGAEGTLGIITAAVLKLFPQPGTRETAWVGVPDLAAACELLSRLREALGDSVTSFEFLSAASLALVLARDPDAAPPFAGAPGFVLLEVSGSAHETLRDALTQALLNAMEAGLIGEVAIAQNETQRRAFWRLREGIPLAEKALGGSIKHDVSVPISALANLAERASDGIRAHWPRARLSVYGHIGDGNLHFNVLAPEDCPAEAFKAQHADAISDLVHGAASALAGSFSAEHGVGKLKRDLLHQTESPLAIDLMQRIKRALDPAGLMNPGKLVG